MLLCVCVCLFVPVCVHACLNTYGYVYLCWREIRRKCSCLSVSVYDCQKKPGEMYSARTYTHIHIIMQPPWGNLACSLSYTVL